ncbi:deoxyribodipyrimidine photo-lyase [Benzoatithermus flavus]|uniref:Deoxyribodipyrimidine photo-lyase n=1 Tax=Benzoatithermus flavus TaxID=3108223 RepID=A0ABU8XUF5_9PROT
MEPERIALLNDEPPAEGRRYVLYWMQAAQRAACNHALEHAIALADRRREPLLVAFGLMDDYPEANLRHYRFMLEGLAETAASLAGRGIRFVLRKGHPAEVALALAQDASLVVCDRGYTRHQRAWRRQVATEAGRQVIEVEGEVVVPVETASAKAEIAARTLRPKILRLREHFLQPLAESRPAVPSLDLPVRGDLDPVDVEGNLAALGLDRSVPPTCRFKGGTAEARARLDRFLARKLRGYRDARSDPSLRQSSALSPYFQFGQISPVEVALRVVAATPAADPDRAAFLEELIVRRELAHNLVWHRPDDYDRYEGLPAWARRSLDLHRNDPRPRTYGIEELEAGRTHDRYFNAAAREMRITGYMHNYMRMYWGKRIIEFTRTPEEAYATALTLNNRHFLCGRGPNAFANVAWLFGRHDRPWMERPIFGQVRYMNDRGLQRKFDIEAYVRWTERLEE